MPLIKTKLIKRLENVYDPNLEPESGSPPLMHSKSARRFANAYHEYAMDAGPLVLVSPGNIEGLVQALITLGLPGWGLGFLNYWTPVTFTGPGLVPTNPISPSLAAASITVTTAMTALIIKGASGIFPSSIRESSKQLAEILDASTRTLQIITTTTTAPPVVAPVPIS